MAMTEAKPMPMIPMREEYGFVMPCRGRGGPVSGRPGPTAMVSGRLPETRREAIHCPRHGRRQHRGFVRADPRLPLYETGLLRSITVMPLGKVKAADWRPRASRSLPVACTGASGLLSSLYFRDPDRNVRPQAFAEAVLDDALSPVRDFEQAGPVRNRNRKGQQMPYMIAQIDIHDPDGYQAYLAGFMPIFVRYGGELLATSKSETEVIRGRVGASAHGHHERSQASEHRPPLARRSRLSGARRASPAIGPRMNLVLVDGIDA